MSFEERKYTPIASSADPTSTEYGSSSSSLTHYTPYCPSQGLLGLINPNNTVSPTSATANAVSASSSTCDAILLQIHNSDGIINSPTLSSASDSHLTMRTRSNGSLSMSSVESTPNNNHRPYLRIIEQPTNRIRYRYKSEKGSHGGLTGENSSQNKKTYPTVKLENYHSNRQVFIKATLYTNESSPKPHVHKLMGKHCSENGICILQLGESNCAIFQNLGILFVGKKEVPEIVYQRKLDEHKLIRAINDIESSISELEKQRLREEADRDAKKINLNCVKICFQAFDQEMNFPICEAVFSRPIANQKSPDSGELKIVRMDKYSGICTGNEEVFLLCEKVNKKEIKIRFFEADIDGNQTWEAFANFTEADVHHQVAIVFRTPAYHDLNIERSVQVFTQLYRPKDGEYSEPRPFTYKPKMLEQDNLEKKRKKVSQGFDDDQFHQGFSGTGRFFPNVNSSGNTSIESSGVYYGHQVMCGHNYHDTYDLDGPKEIKLNSIKNMTIIGEKNNDEKWDNREYGKKMYNLLRKYVITGRPCLLLTPFKHLISISNQENDSILHLAIIHRPKEVDMLRNLLKLSSDLPINPINSQNSIGQTPLHIAAILNETDVIKELMKAGANPNIIDNKGNSPLHIACELTHLDTISCILEEYNGPKIDPNLFNYEGLTALHLAVIKANKQIIRKLISNKADINAKDGKAGRTPLHFAVQKDLSLVQILLENPEININQQDYSGNTALHLACSIKSKEIVKVLIKFNADPYIENFDKDNEDDSQNDAQQTISRGKLPSDLTKDRSILELFHKLNQHKLIKSDDVKLLEEIINKEKISSSCSIHLEKNTKEKWIESMDSGYESSKLKILSENQLGILAKNLDTPNNDWQKLAICLGFEIEEIAKRDKSPTRYMIEIFEKSHKGTLSMLQDALEIAQLHHVIEYLK